MRSEDGPDVQPAPEQYPVRGAGGQSPQEGKRVESELRIGPFCVKLRDFACAFRCRFSHRSFWTSLPARAARAPASAAALAASAPRFVETAGRYRNLGTMDTTGTY